MIKKTITRNGQTVDCYGKWQEDSNCICVFADAMLHAVYADGADNWADAVEKLTDYAKRNGTELLELIAC